MSKTKRCPGIEKGVGEKKMCRGGGGGGILLGQVDAPATSNNRY